MRHDSHVLNINRSKRLEESRMHLFPIVVRCGEVMEHRYMKAPFSHSGRVRGCGGWSSLTTSKLRTAEIVENSWVRSAGVSVNLPKEVLVQFSSRPS